jgi:hypothetical protein
MNQPAIVLARHMVSVRRQQVRTRPLPTRAGLIVLRLACAGLLARVAAIHLHLWSEGYRHIPTYGPLFLADVIAGFALAAVLVVWPRPVAGLAGAAYMASTLGGLVLSINFGLFGFRESSGASFVLEAILLESLGTVALLAWSAGAGASGHTRVPPYVTSSTGSDEDGTDDGRGVAGPAVRG